MKFDIKEKDKYDGGDWSWLLRDQPQFAEHRPWKKLGGWGLVSFTKRTTTNL